MIDYNTLVIFTANFVSQNIGQPINVDAYKKIPLLYTVHRMLSKSIFYSTILPNQYSLSLYTFYSHAGRSFQDKIKTASQRSRVLNVK